MSEYLYTVELYDGEMLSMTDDFGPNGYTVWVDKDQAEEACDESNQDLEPDDPERWRVIAFKREATNGTN